MMFRGVFGFLLSLAFFAPAYANTGICQKLFAQPTASASVEELSERKTLRIATYNPENLIATVGRYEYDQKGQYRQTSERDPKPEHKTRGVAETIKKMEPDILFLQELESVQNAQLFVDQHLGGKFEVFGTGIGDRRGIITAVAISRDLMKHFDVKVKSFADITWVDPVGEAAGSSMLFDRDPVGLEMYRKSKGARGPPDFMLLGVHLKSKRDRPGDPESRLKRDAQIKGTMNIVSELKRELGESARIVLAGDFNGDVMGGPEFQSFRKNLGLRDALDANPQKLSPADRVTHTYHPRDGQMQARQLDGIFLSPSLADAVVESRVQPYYNTDGSVMPIPKSFGQRDRQPSDHRPVVTTLDFQKIYETLD